MKHRRNRTHKGQAGMNDESALLWLDSANAQVVNPPSIDLAFFAYDAPGCAIRPHCHLRVWTRDLVVVATEVDSNPGPSITTAAEALWPDVSRWLVDMTGRINQWTYVEHYPGSPLAEVTIAAGKAQWQPLAVSQPETADMIARHLESVNERTVNRREQARDREL